MDKLGIEPIQLLTQIFNFSLMVFILTKILYKPVMGMLEERRKKIAEGLKYSQSIKDELDKIEKKKEAVLDNARKSARRIIDDAREAAVKNEEEIILAAQQEAAAVMEKTRKEMETERAEMEKTIRKEAVEIAAVMTEKILSEVLTDRDQRSIIDKKIKTVANLKT